MNQRATTIPFQQRRTDSWIESSVSNPSGDGVRDLQFLRTQPDEDLSRWYDTYDGTPAPHAPQWFALCWQQLQSINTCVFMHGPMFPVGGWWQTLELHYRDEHGNWQPLNYTITPTYDFDNQRNERQPFAVFGLTFAPVVASGIRLSGTCGGSMELVTLRYLDAGFFDQAQRTALLEELQVPTPAMFTLLQPAMLWDVIDSLRDITHIVFDAQSTAGLGLDHFLDWQRYQHFHTHTNQIYDSNSLYQLYGSNEGWDVFGKTIRETRQLALERGEAVITEHHGGMVWICIPVVVNGQPIGTVENRNLIIRDHVDGAWHAAAPTRYGIAAADYTAQLATLPVFSAAQLATIIKLIQQIVELAQQRIHEGIHVQALQTTVEELGVPILPIWRHVLAVPLIGNINADRAAHLTSSVLHRITSHQARIIIIDLTGVTTMDEQVVTMVAHLAQTTMLVGAECFFSGLRPDVALALVRTEAKLGHIAMFANLRSALEAAIKQVS